MAVVNMAWLGLFFLDWGKNTNKHSTPPSSQCLTKKVIIDCTIGRGGGRGGGGRTDRGHVRDVTFNQDTKPQKRKGTLVIYRDAFDMTCVRVCACVEWTNKLEMDDAQENNLKVLILFLKCTICLANHVIILSALLQLWVGCSWHNFELSCLTYCMMLVVICEKRRYAMAGAKNAFIGVSGSRIFASGVKNPVKWSFFIFQFWCLMLHLMWQPLLSLQSG